MTSSVLEVVLKMVSRLCDNESKHLERLRYKYEFGDINIQVLFESLKNR